MPILFDARTATAHFPGIGRYVSNLTRALAQLAPDALTLITPPPSAATRWPLPALPSLVSDASPFALNQQWQIPALLRRAHATLYHSAYYLMPYAPGVPTLCTFYDLIPLFYPTYYRPAQRLLYRVTHQLALNAARIGLAISHATQADLVRVFRVPAAKLLVTPLAADPHFAPQTETAVQAARQRYHLPEKYGLYLGSNKPHKNLPLLIDAYAQTDRQTPLVIAGLWDARYPEARQKAEAHHLADRVQFLGPIPEADLPALYGGAEWFVFPSRYEGFGLPPLEALACGTPVLCSDLPVLREVAGEAALYFDPTQAEALAAALQRAQTDAALRAELRARAQPRAALFSWERAAHQTWAAYQALLSTP